MFYQMYFLESSLAGLCRVSSGFREVPGGFSLFSLVVSSVIEWGVLQVCWAGCAGPVSTSPLNPRPGFGHTSLELERVQRSREASREALLLHSSSVHHITGGHVACMLYHPV